MECNGAVTAADRATYVCACMRITHADLLEALADQTIRTLSDLRCHTGAGAGCMACHRRLRCYLEPVEQKACA